MRGNGRKNALEMMLLLLDELVSSPRKMIILETALKCKILWGKKVKIQSCKGKCSERKTLNCKKKKKRQYIFLC